MNQKQKVEKEQEALNALVDAGITSGKQYTDQTARLEKAQRGLAFQTRTTNLSIQDQFFFIASIAGQMLPRAIEGFTKLREIQAQAARSAISAVKTLQSAINSLEGKTIEIRIIRRFITIGNPFAFQRGGSFIVDKPTMISGKQVGEFSKPELVTVTPLSNPNDVQDKSTTINLGSVKRAVNADTKGKKGSIKKGVLEPIFITMDGEVIMKLVQKRLLEFAVDNII